jgi:hypothetical protein
MLRPKEILNDPRYYIGIDRARKEYVSRHSRSRRILADQRPQTRMKQLLTSLSGGVSAKGAMVLDTIIAFVLKIL